MTEKDVAINVKYCPLRQSNIQPLKCIGEVQPLKCIGEYCMFFRKGYRTTDGRGPSDSCWIKDGFVGLARTWEIKE